MSLHFIEHATVGGGDAFNALLEQMGFELIHDGFADQPEGVIGQICSCTRLIEADTPLLQ